MKDKVSRINNEFYKNFPEIYLKPSKVNKFLKKYTNEVEKEIKNKFLKLKLDKNFVIYANGGFGRKEIFPISDIDISIVEKNKPKDFKNLEEFISFLWDQGYKVGHSVRTISDIKKISKSDLKEYTSYLTRRPIISTNEMDKKINYALSTIWTKNNFYNAKYVEQQQRHSEFFSTAYNLEPDLKESPGTLRDFQSALWILQHCFDLKSVNEISKSRIFNGELNNAIDAYNFIKSLRFATNISTNKNRLDFEAQIEISKKAKLGKRTTKKSVEMMMKKFYEMASSLSYFNEIVYEKYNEKYPRKNFFKKIEGIHKYKNKIGIQNINLKNNKSLIFEIFIEIGKSKIINSIDTETKSLIRKNISLIDKEFRRNEHYANQFLEILKSKYNLSSILRTMKSLGVLQNYIPEFDSVIGQMQFDLFHVYTVDEHTFKVVRNMRQMKLNKQPGFELEHELINKLPKIEILYIAGLFHDLGKGKGGNHSEIGAKSSFRFAKRLGMSNTDASLISWLVKKHLIMSSISQKKDITDPNTVSEFLAEVKQDEKLNYLYLLTINDIRATNPALWNGWKHQLLRDLYLLTRSKINKKPLKASSQISLDRQKNVINNFKNKDEKLLIKKHFKNFEDSYFNKHSSESLIWQSELIIKNKNNKLIVGCKRKFDNLIEIFVKVEDSPGLFYKLVWILEHSGLEIIDANIFSSESNKLAANTFITKYSRHDRTLNKSELIDLCSKIEKNFNKEDGVYEMKLLKKKNMRFEKNIKINESINFDKNRNLITVETVDSSGLLANIAKVFFENKVSIHSARINTLGERVEDTFEIENFNKKLVPNYKIKKIVSKLKKVV
ncbi:MAG: [protein-PII] uridylyltransferase [SAR86 cluster bacterium]|uniref:Bifunctional uridylyltransferase/uridylyl-removing enzyme n=1 Tax=SAR86 cluster bacterium TaxID=2030880 RepID=A0A520N3I1_9GAMM|nr:MAG: [protein-PII] uridylyltransferase [SAR86 cluster bacterium]